MNSQEKAIDRAAKRAGKGDPLHAFKSESTGEKIGTIVLYLVMTILVLLVLLPVLNIIACSFSEPQAVISGKVGLWPVNPTLRGYDAVFKYKKFWIGLRNSIFYTVFGTFVNIVMTVLCAYPLSRKEFTARNKISMYFVFTMYFSGGLVPTFLVITKLQLVDTIWAMIIPVAMSSYNMIICRTYMVNSIPDELYEAGELDGCTPFQYLIRVVVPLCKPILAVLVLYYAVGHWNSYFNALLYINKTQMQVVQIILRNIMNQASMAEMDETLDYGSAGKPPSKAVKMASTVVATVPILVVYPFVQRFFTQGVMVGAVKG